ncbi:MAG: hypothetical protein J2P54_09120 [Bradyrhizobiaceae bacterium]|nr:hypothetical protein [Bradyrhizobiaceae bacterium]
MSKIVRPPVDELAPVQVGGKRRVMTWTERLLVFQRIMASISMLKGLYHWALVCGFGAEPYGGFESHPVHWQTATVFFAVFDLVAAVGLWLAAPWGVVVWLTSSVAMVGVEMFFPHVYGGHSATVIAETAFVACYLFIALKSAREQPQ